MIDTADIDLATSVRLGRSLVASLTGTAPQPGAETADDDKESR